MDMATLTRDPSGSGNVFELGKREYDLAERDHAQLAAEHKRRRAQLAAEHKRALADADAQFADQVARARAKRELLWVNAALRQHVWATFAIWPCTDGGKVSTREMFRAALAHFGAHADYPRELAVTRKQQPSLTRIVNAAHARAADPLYAGIRFVKGGFRKGGEQSGGWYGARLDAPLASEFARHAPELSADDLVTLRERGRVTLSSSGDTLEIKGKVWRDTAGKLRIRAEIRPMAAWLAEHGDAREAVTA